MRKFIKAHTIATVAIIVSFVVAIFLVVTFIAAIFSLSASNCSGSSNDIAPAGDTSGAVDLDKNAKKIFEFMVKKEGFSGAGAAGAVGNAFAESRFDPKAGNASGAVVGIFQWGAGGVNGDRLHKGGFIKGPEDYTLENELKLTDYELNHGFKSAKNKVGHDTDPVTAAIDWEDMYEIAPGQAVEARTGAAQEAYRKFGGANISANDSILGNTAAAGEAGANADASDGTSCQNGSEGEGNSDMLSIAKKLLGYFTYSFARPVLQNTMSNPGGHDVSDVNKSGTTDCSGFVWLVCYLAGYKVPAGGWYTGSMYQDATGPKQYLKQVDESSAKAGDIVVCGGPGSTGAGGHTAILAENWHGKDTKVINEGGGMDMVNEHPFWWAFGDALGNDQRIFCEPVAKR